MPVQGTCVISDCERPARYSDGLCGPHYQHRRKYGDATAPRVNHRNGGPCSVEGCDAPARAAGMCVPHYDKARRSAPADPPSRPRRSDAPCIEDGCDTPAAAKERCLRHYTAALRASAPPAGAIEVNCAGCGVPLPRATPAQRGAAAAGRAVYHSRECRAAQTQVEVTCAVCGKTTRKYRSQIAENTTGVFFCGSACARIMGTKPARKVTLICAHCEKEFPRAPAAAALPGTAYCSQPCKAAAQRGERVERPEVPCAVCGTVMRLEPDQVRQGVRTCSRECTSINRRRKPGERYIEPSGYAWITTPDGRNMPEHRWVMEQQLGRALLPEETVHHRTGGFAGRSNNDPANLELWTGKHQKGHRVEDVVAYAREILALYGTDAERAAYAAHLPPEARPPG